MDEDDQSRRFRRCGDGSTEFNDGKDRGDGRTSFGTFPRGKSGNPGGRPPGALNATTIIRQQLSQKVFMNTPNGRVAMSKLAASVAKLTTVGLMNDNVRALERTIALGLLVEEKTDARKTELPLHDADRAVLALLANRLVRQQEEGGGDDSNRGTDDARS